MDLENKQEFDPVTNVEDVSVDVEKTEPKQKGKVAFRIVFILALILAFVTGALLVWLLVFDGQPL